MGCIMNILEEIIYQLKCVKNHLDFLNTEYIPVGFDAKVLESCISQIEEINNNSLIFPHTINNITYYNREELIELVKQQRILNGDEYGKHDMQ